MSALKLLGNIQSALVTHVLNLGSSERDTHEPMLLGTEKQVNTACKIDFFVYDRRYALSATKPNYYPKLLDRQCLVACVVQGVYAVYSHEQIKAMEMQSASGQIGDIRWGVLEINPDVYEGLTAARGMEDTVVADCFQLNIMWK